MNQMNKVCAIALLIFSSEVYPNVLDYPAGAQTGTIALIKGPIKFKKLLIFSTANARNYVIIRDGLGRNIYNLEVTPGPDRAILASPDLCVTGDKTHKVEIVRGGFGRVIFYYDAC